VESVKKEVDIICMKIVLTSSRIVRESIITNKISERDRFVGIAMED
jgi:hypothetical protein